MSKSSSKYKAEDYKKATELADKYNNRYAAEVMGVHPRTIRKWKAIVRKEQLNDDFTVEDFPTGNEPIGDLIENRIKKFALKNKAKNSERLVNIKINMFRIFNRIEIK